MLQILQKFSALLIYPIIALFISTVLTFICIRVLPKLGYIDKPGGRHIHKKAVPRGGGIAIIIAFFIGAGLYVLNVPEDMVVIQNHGIVLGHSARLFLHLFIPAVILGILGLIDDYKPLKAFPKLFIQIIVAFIIWYTGRCNFTFAGWQCPWYFSMILSMAWVIVIINSFNLIDGLDGIAAGTSVVSSFCMGIWFLLVPGHMNQAVVMFILSGACLGFLRYNFHPAKIFLGDTGSTFLGLIFAIIGLSTVEKVVTFSSLLLPLLAVGVPLFDVFLAVWRRSMRKMLNPKLSGIMTADQDHLHHRLLRRTNSQAKTAYVMYLITCCFALAGFVVILFRGAAPAIMFLIVCIGLVIAVRQLAVIELYDSVLLMQVRVLKPHRGILLNLIHPFIDFAILTVSYVIAAFLTLGTLGSFYCFIYAFVPVALCLCFSGIYKVYWLRASLDNYWKLGLILFVGLLISCFCLYLFCFSSYHFQGDNVFPMCHFTSLCLLYVLLALSLISFERFAVHYIEGFWMRKLCVLKQVPVCHSRVLIYGGGLICRLYINYFNCAKKDLDVSETLVGIVDEDKALHGLVVYGSKVLGGSDELERIHKETPFDKIIATTDKIHPEYLKNIQEFVKEKGIKFCYFRVCEKDTAE